MKLFNLLIFMCGCNFVYAADFKTTLADPTWDGQTIPANQHCSRFDGNGATPPLHVTNIPAGSNAIIVEFSDKTYQPMDNGGHGKLGFRLSSDTLTEIKLPRVNGHTFDLPKKVFLVEAQRAPTWDKAGAYLPPCSGGKGNQYTATVRAVKMVDGGIRETLGEVEIALGKY